MKEYLYDPHTHTAETSKCAAPLPQFERDSLNHGKKAFYGRIPV